jgi:hypothetical protein
LRHQRRIEATEAGWELISFNDSYWLCGQIRYASQTKFNSDHYFRLRNDAAFSAALKTQSMCADVSLRFDQMLIREFHHAANTLRRAASLPSDRLSSRRISIMDREGLEARLRHARERAQRWKGEHQRLESIKRVSDRRQDTRKKIWAGGWLLNAIKDDPIMREKFAEHLRTVKFRKGERDLFADLLGNDVEETR